MAVERIEKLTEEQVVQLHALYQSEFWSQGRTLEDVREMLRHTDVIVAFCDEESKQLLGFSRLLTDYVYKAFLFDVIVHESQRGSGLGRMLLDAIVHHPQLKNVRHIELYCRPHMVPFYEKWGFTQDLGGALTMRRVLPVE